MRMTGIKPWQEGIMGGEVHRTFEMKHEKHVCAACMANVTRIIKMDGQKYCVACYRKKNLEKLISGESKVDTYYRGQL
jgi:hypothetical protein